MFYFCLGRNNLFLNVTDQSRALNETLMEFIENVCLPQQCYGNADESTASPISTPIETSSSSAITGK